MARENMANPSQTLLTLVNHLLTQHPELAQHVERLAQNIQGKGYGTATIAQENEVVHALLGKEPTLVVDIGGNAGEYTAEVRRRNPNAEIHVFEPSATNITKLGQRFGGDPKVRLLPYAVSDQNGAATLYSNESGSGLGSLSQRRLEHRGIDFRVTESVHTIRFEDYWRRDLNGAEIDIVKIDIEGHELSALKGFGEAVSCAKVIQFEFGGCNIDTRTYFQDFWYFFKEQGFDLYRITPFGAEAIRSYKEEDEYFSTTNYIAVNRKVNEVLRLPAEP
jgi:FkbM family methyltransferase